MMPDNGNLPPGCTQEDIDDAFGDQEEDTDEVDAWWLGDLDEGKELNRDEG